MRREFNLQCVDSVVVGDKSKSGESRTDLCCVAFQVARAFANDSRVDVSAQNILALWTHKNDGGRIRKVHTFHCVALC